MIIFDFSKLQLTAILDFLFFGILDAQAGVYGPDALTCQILSKSVKRLRRYVDFLVFKMAAVHNLGFVGQILGLF